MRRIESRIDIASEEFRLNRAHNRGLADTLRERQQAARRERPARDLDRLSRQNKMFVRDRIELLLDPGTPFLELSTLAANSEYGGEVPGAGIVSGIGIVNGREIIIHADDASVKGGAWYPLSVKKIVRTLDIAIENRLPVVHLCDSAGGFLPLQADIFADRYLAGRIFRNQSILSKTGRSAGRDRARPLHGGRRLRAGPERIQCDRSRHRRDLPGRAAAGESGNRRGRDGRRTRRRRRAYAHLRHRRLSGNKRGAGDRDRTRIGRRRHRDRRSSMSNGSRRSRLTTIRKSFTVSSRATSKSSSTCAR